MWERYASCKDDNSGKGRGGGKEGRRNRVNIHLVLKRRRCSEEGHLGPTDVTASILLSLCSLHCICISAVVKESRREKDEKSNEKGWRRIQVSSATCMQREI